MSEEICFFAHLFVPLPPENHKYEKDNSNNLWR
jgi:hypothetical protein